MAKVFVTLRLTGHVSNGVARDLLAQLQACTDAFAAEGVEVKQSVDARLDPEAAPEPEPKPEPMPEHMPVVEPVAEVKVVEPPKVKVVKGAR